MIVDIIMWVVLITIITAYIVMLWMAVKLCFIYSKKENQPYINGKEDGRKEAISEMRKKLLNLRKGALGLVRANFEEVDNILKEMEDEEWTT